MSKIRTLYDNPFVAKAINDAIAVRRELVKDRRRLDSEFARDPDMDEFYVIRVAQSTGDVLNWCKQMEHAVEFLSDFSYSKRMRERGIKRHHHFLYNVENYIIRTQILYELLLQLVNRVFHLLNKPQNCTYPVITQNLKVARTAVPSLLKEVQRPLLPYRQHRNVIIHRESYNEEELSKVEMLYFVDHLPDEPGDDAVVSATDGLHHLRTQMLARLISEKRVEFNAVNTEVFALLLPLFNALESVYEGERLSLTILSVQSERLTP